MDSLNNKNNMFDLLIQGAMVVTPNNRLSAALLKEYFAYCNHHTVDKPKCLPFSTMIRNTYQQLTFNEPEHAHPTLLNDAQCQHLWRNIIKKDETITFSEGLLNALMQAWENCQQWNIECDDPSFNYTPQTQHFQQWWRTFEKKLERINAITEHQLIPYLTLRGFAFSHTLIWVSFDEYTPQQLHLQEYLNSLDVSQYRYDLLENNALPQRFAAKNTQEEYQQLIAWLQVQIQHGASRIGVVIPDLAQESRALQRLLLQHFDPSLFNISLGQTLNQFTLVAHALMGLNIDSYLTPHQAALLLQSPYIGFAKDEFVARSHYLQESTLLQNPLFSLNTLIEDLDNQAPKLTALLKTMISLPHEASPNEWVIVFQERLNALGFPGDYGLNSENYQSFNRFVTLLDEFRQLSLINNRLTKTEALVALAELTANTIFQAQKTDAPIQISGLLEASGCEFDSLWVMGLTDQCLPQKTRLSAFIAPHLQRELVMPHSTPSRELHFAQQTLKRLQRGSNCTVFSYAKLQGDNPHLPCSLITHFPHFEPLPLSIEMNSPNALIEMEEPYLVSPTVNERLSGGTALLANQAKCPFKAFAQHRLKARPLLHTAEGLESKEKGQIIHKIMELIWQNLGSQQQLFRLNSTELMHHIDEVIQTTLTPMQQIHPDAFPDLIQEVESARLKRLVLLSLEWEKQRSPFTVIAIEQSYSITLAELDFSVRVDRIDQVEDKKWVIDYKSNLPSSKPWNEDRPKEPQLLLYALLDDEINALVLMQLKTGTVLCHGLSEDKHPISGITSLKKEESWEKNRVKWHQQLTLLAQELQEGHCPPQPATAALCQQCDFQSLCRFQPNS